MPSLRATRSGTLPWIASPKTSRAALPDKKTERSLSSRCSSLLDLAPSARAAVLETGAAAAADASLVRPPAATEARAVALLVTVKVPADVEDEADAADVVVSVVADVVDAEAA